MYRIAILGVMAVVPLVAVAQELDLPPLPGLEDIPSTDISAPKEDPTMVNPAADILGDAATPEDESLLIEDPSILPGINIEPEESALEGGTPSDTPSEALADIPPLELETLDDLLLQNEEAASADVTDTAADADALALPTLEEAEAMDALKEAKASAEAEIPPLPEFGLPETAEGEALEATQTETGLPPLPLPGAEMAEAPTAPTPTDTAAAPAPPVLPFPAVPALPGQPERDGNPVITFGAPVDAVPPLGDVAPLAPVEAKDPYQKYAGKMPKNPAKTKLRYDYNYKRQYLPPQIYRTEYDRENKHLPRARSIDDYERAVFVAAQKNDTNGLRALKRQIGTLQLRSDSGDTPLMVAAHAGALDAAFLLIAHGANVSDRNYRGASAIDYARARGDHAMMQLLSSPSPLASRVKLP